MKRRTYIQAAAMPPRLPVLLLVVTWLMLDRLHVPDWAWGVYWTISVLLAVLTVVDLARADKKPLPGYGDEA
jgi:hypothetical protein